MTKRYRIISPMTTDNIYESGSMFKCAKKCYNELKLNKINIDQFTIQDIDTSETFTFAINKKHSQSVHVGGSIETSRDIEKYNDLNKYLKSIDYRINVIEKKIKADECIIM
jgi:hypothetical protein